MSRNSKSGSKPATAAVNATTKDKFIELTKTLQFAWFAGHAVVLVSSIFYFCSFSQIPYRIAYLGVLHSFGIIAYQQYYLNSKPASGAAAAASKFSLHALLNDENVLYFVLGLLWFVTPIFALSLVPYMMFSLFHALRYLQNILLPKVFGSTKENSSIAQRIDTFTQNYNERCMYWVGTTELLIFVVLMFRAVLWYRASWILLISYALFMKVRYETSKYTKAAFAQWRVRLDGVISHPSVPPTVKRAYNSTKSRLIELSRYQLTKAQPVSGSAEEQKKNF